MDHFGWPELGIVGAMVATLLANVALQLGIVVAGVWIALTLWHRSPRRHEHH
jgi:hypothetical protein